MHGLANLAVVSFIIKLFFYSFVNVTGQLIFLEYSSETEQQIINIIMI